ncbi:MAG: asparagine synthase (glutamine-hydrolyzing) [bacterium]
MCGICGALNIGAKRTTEDDVRAMTAMLSHRGPDAARVVSDGHVILGHARLSIIDLSGGGQPMASHDRRYWIVFNGEIFNYLELRTELEGLGYTFVTRSDTEVIIEAYRAWGGSCFRRFNGQWGVAIWDRAEGTVTIARDRVGIRPLYYCRIGTSILFSSEIKSLFAHPRVQRGLSPSGLAQAFTFWSPVAPRTAFEGIEQLPPGTYMAVRLENGSVNTERYWEPTFGTDETVRSGSLDENAARLRDLIVEAARLRFDRSDVPVGAYLSGGIDSTVTTAVLARYTDAPLKTFSVAFSDGEFDESGGFGEGFADDEVAGEAEGGDDGGADEGEEGEPESFVSAAGEVSADDDAEAHADGGGGDERAGDFGGFDVGDALGGA